MNLLNIFRKNKYYEQLLFKALIQITCYRANVGEKRTEAELGGWPHYIVNYLVGKEMRDYTWSEDDESTTNYLSNYLSRARQKISVLLKLSTISRFLCLRLWKVLSTQARTSSGPGLAPAA